MTIDRQEDFERDEILPSWVMNRVQDRVAGLSSLRLELASSTTVRAAAGADGEAAALNIGGDWRFVDAPVTRVHPGGAAGTYLVFATSTAQDVRIVPEPGSDFTVYAFALAIVADGDTPTIVPGAVDIFVQVGELEWDGAAITSLVQEFGAITRPQIEVALAQRVLSALPTTAGFDGQEILFQTAGMAAADVGPWRLRYEEEYPGASKWKVLSADWWLAATASAEAQNSVGYAVVANAPAITSPAPGSYDVEHGAQLNVNASLGMQALRVGAVAPTDFTSVAFSVSAGLATCSVAVRTGAGAVAGGDVITLWGKTNGSGPCTFAARWLAIKPRRLG